MSSRICLATLGVVIALATVSQAAEPPLPEFYGLYAVADGKLYSLDTSDPTLAARAQSVRVSRTEKEFSAGGGVTLSVPSLPPNLNFLVYVKGNALQAASQLDLRQLPFIRTMTINANDRNWRRTYHTNSWVSTTEFGYANVGATKVELRFKPVKGQEEMVLAVPATALNPGLYRLGGDFLFAVSDLGAAESDRCIDATNGAAMGPWSVVRCSDVEAEIAASGAPSHTTSKPSPTGEVGVGFEVAADDVPLYSSAEGQEIKARLVKGTLCANAKGRSLGTPNEFRLEENNGRVHVAYLHEMRTMKDGWVDSSALDRFTYECSCSPARCTPINFSLRAHTWNDCFERAIQARRSKH